MAAAARFYDVLRDAGVIGVQLILENVKEYIIAANYLGPSEGAAVECDDMTMIMSYRNGTSVMSKGMLRSNFAAPDPLTGRQGKITFMEYVFEQHIEMIKRAVILKRPAESPSKQLTSPAPQQSPVPKQHDDQNDLSMDQDPDDSSPPSSSSSTNYPPRPYKRRRKSKDEGPRKSSSSERDEARHRVTCREYAAESIKYEELSVPAPAVEPAGVSDRAMRILEVRKRRRERGKSSHVWLVLGNRIARPCSLIFLRGLPLTQYPFFPFRAARLLSLSTILGN